MTQTTKVVLAAAMWLFTASAMAGDPISSASSAAAVPELDGGLALLALALTAAIVAIVKERRRG